MPEFHTHPDGARLMALHEHRDELVGHLRADHGITKDVIDAPLHVLVTWHTVSHRVQERVVR